MKEFRIITLEEVRDILMMNFFMSPMPGPFFKFIPEALLEWANQSEIKITMDQIPGWEDFEYGRMDFGNADFYKLLFDDNISSINDEIVLISDETIKSNIAIA